MKTQFKIDKLNDENFVLNKNKEFHKLFEITLSIYDKFVQDIEKITKHKYKENDEFIELLIILKDENQQILISKPQLQLLSKWIDGICTILLEKENVDYKNKDLNDYFRIASKFNKTTKELFLEK